MCHSFERNNADKYCINEQLGFIHISDKSGGMIILLYLSIPFRGMALLLITGVD